MNPLSMLGRMQYSAHMAFYPLVVLTYVYGYKPYAANKKIASEKEEWDNLIPAKPVDRDIFNPYTPIPYHNNRQLKYSLDHIDMFGYLNENHINTRDYRWKQYNNLYDHDDKNLHKYNWTSYHPHD